MKKVFLQGLLFVLSCIPVVSSGQLTARSITYNSRVIGYYQFLPPDFSATRPRKFPLIISLHGAGETSNIGLSAVLNYGLPKLLAASNRPTMQFTERGVTTSFVVLAPQKNELQFIPFSHDYVDAMINYALANLNVDPDKIFLTGYSLGAGEVWDYPSASVANANKIAGIIPVSGTPISGNICYIAQNKVAVFAIHGTGDEVVGYNYAENAVNTVNSCPAPTPPAAKIPAIMNALLNGSHKDGWDRAYDTTNNILYPNIYQWMIGITKANNPATNQTPITGIGPDLTLAAPQNSISLSGAGSYDPNDVITKYQWTQISGPASAPVLTFSNPDRPTTNITNLRLGTYLLRLTVTDYLGVTAFDDKQVTITDPGVLPPIVTTEPDRVLNSNSTVLNGSAFDWDGTVNASAFRWQQISGPMTVSIPFTDFFQVNASNFLLAGNYVFRLTATDNEGNTGSDLLTITRSAQGALPVELISFKGKNLGEKNILQWSTGREVNFDKFEILRSSDGKNFSSIATMKSQSGNQSQKDYTYNDIAPKGVSHYQLKQVDKDNSFKLSKVITINNKNQAFVIEKYPNPVTAELNLSIEGTIFGIIELDIVDVQGSVVKRISIRKDQTLWKGSIDVRALARGMYVLQMKSSDGRKESSNFIKN